MLPCKGVNFASQRVIYFASPIPTNVFVVQGWVDQTLISTNPGVNSEQNLSLMVVTQTSANHALNILDQEAIVSGYKVVHFTTANNSNHRLKLSVYLYWFWSIEKP